MLDVLAFGAHPDDIEIFAGGTIAACVRRGLRVGLVHLTRGEMGTRGSAELRATEAADAATALGVASHEILDLGDGGLHDDDVRRARVVAILRRERPRLVLASLAHDAHPDHAATGALVKSSSYLSGIRKFAAAESAGAAAHRPSLVLYYPSHDVLAPTLVVALTAEDVERKMRSIRAYASQVHDPKSAAPETRISRPEFLEAIVARMRTHGGAIGAEFGEPWCADGAIRVNALDALLA